MFPKNHYAIIAQCKEKEFIFYKNVLGRDILKTDMKSRLNAFIEKNRHGFLLLYFCIYFPWFHHLERTVTTHFHVIHTALDDMIPFCEYLLFLIFYGLDMSHGQSDIFISKIKMNILNSVQCFLPE